MSNAQPLLKQFPCPGCGASLEFHPGAAQLKCPYCGREEALPQSTQKVVERSLDEFANANRTQIAQLSVNALEVSCPGCRAQLTFQPPDVAGRCPFCATNIVAQPHAPSPVITPEGILPFSLTQKAARERIRKWLSTRWFAPNGLKKMAQQEGIQGVYLPFWTYDAQTETHYTGERGKHYYTTETYTATNSEGKSETRTRQVRHTRWHMTSGRVSRWFDDVLLPAVRSLNTQRLEQLEPWNLQKLVPYDPSYLAGFKAQRYQITVKEGFELAKGKMEPTIRSDIRRDIGGDEQRIHSMSTTYSATTFKHLLLPVWVSSYRFNKKQYQVMVNAQTGEVLGDRPYSVWKISLAVVSAAAVVAAFFGVKDYLQNPRPLFEPQPSHHTPAPLTGTPLPSSTPRSTTPSVTPPTDTAFRDAINAAGQAANLTQTAQTRQDWEQIANLWVQAIERMKAVPVSDPNYAIAQQKVQEYQRNLNYARQELAKRS